MKKRLTLVAAIVLLLTTVFVLPLTSVVREQEDDKTIYKSSLKIEKNNNIELKNQITNKDENITIPQISTDIVNVTVELSTASLSEEFIKTEKNDITTFLKSDDAKNFLNNIQNEQKDFKSDLERIIGKENVTNAKSTAVAINSVSFSCKYGQLSEIKNLKNVKYAYTSIKLKPMAEENENNKASQGIVNKPNNNHFSDENLTGAGTVIALLDTGFDIEHDIFSFNSENGKYSQDEFLELLTTLTQCINGEYLATELYNNQKILFSYDYYDNDNDVSTEVSSHGMMSAGIASGNTEDIPMSSNAYNSQLLLMKCSSDSSENTDSISILLAIEDSLKLGADIINIGYGNTEILDTDFSQSYGEMFNRIYKSGTAVVMPVGNLSKDSFTENNTETIDNGTASPISSLPGIISVSDIEDSKLYDNYFVCDKKQIIYNFPKNADGSYNSLFRDLVDGNYNYTIIDGDGDEASYKNIDTSGKIVFVRDGGITADKKIDIAYKHKADAVVIFGNNEIILSNATEIPVAVAYEFALSTLDKTGKLTISSKNILQSKNKNDGKIYETASLGSNGNLLISTDIADISSNYSSILKNRYGISKGSSFASASVAGKISMLKQYINNDERFSNYTPEEKNSLIYNLIISTSNIITDNKVPENVRAQGSGAIDIQKALNAKAYLSTDNNLPKLELGSSPEGKYTVKFNITNISDNDIDYNLSATILTNSFNESKKISERIEISTANSLIEFIHNNKVASKIKIKANSTETVLLKIKINPVFILNLLSTYKNGSYLDGFVTLTSDTETTLSAPILGFIGDYNSQNAFDSFIYDNEKPINGKSSYLYIASNDDKNNDAIILGYNKFLKKYDEDNLSFNSKMLSKVTGKNDIDNISLYIRSIANRNIKDFRCVVKNENDTTIFETKPFNCSKYSISNQITSINTQLTSLSNGKYTLTISGKIEELPDKYYEQSRTFTFTVDNKKPNNTLYRTFYNDNKTYLEVKGKDDCGIQGFDIYVAIYNEKTGKYEYGDSLFNLMKDTDIPIYGDTVKLIEHYVTDDGNTVFIYDIQKLKPMLERLSKNYGNKNNSLKISQTKVAFAAVDYAYNYSEIKLCDTIVYDDLTLKFTDNDDNPVKNVEIEVNKRKFISDENGKITCANLPAGNYKVKITSIPNNLCVGQNPFTITVGENTKKQFATIKLMPEGTYKDNSNNNSTLNSKPSDKINDPEHKPGKELNPKEPQTEDTDASIFALIIVAALLAVSIVAFLISKKKFKL